PLRLQLPLKRRSASAASAQCKPVSLLIQPTGPGAVPRRGASSGQVPADQVVERKRAGAAQDEIEQRAGPQQVVGVVLGIDETLDHQGHAEQGSAPSLVARPSSSRIGVVSSTAVARVAASSGGSSGTRYSLAKSCRVVSQLASLTLPE